MFFVGLWTSTQFISDTSLQYQMFIYQTKCWYSFQEGIHCALWLGPVVRSVAMADCRSRGCEFDPSLIRYFCWGWSWNIFKVTPLLLIQEGLMSVKSKSMYTKYWLTALVKLAQEKCVVRLNDSLDLTTVVDLDVKPQTTKNAVSYCPKLVSFPTTIFHIC